MVVFLDSFNGTSKDKNKPYQRITLMEIKQKKDGGYFSQVVSFFVDDIDCSALKCGDRVRVKMEQGEGLSAKMRLSSVIFDGVNVFEKYI